MTKDTLPKLQEKIQRDYLQEYQKFVSWVDERCFTEEIIQREGYDAGVVSPYLAFVHLVGPIPGVSYGRPIEDYGNRAIELLVKFAAEGVLPSDSYCLGYHNDRYHFAFLWTYDWMFQKMTPDQRRLAANFLADAGNRMLSLTSCNAGLVNGRVGGLWTTTYALAPKPWYIGAGIVGPEVDPAKTAPLLNSFASTMLGGYWLDAQNWLARRSGGAHSFGNYMTWQIFFDLPFLHGWLTATGENWFAKGTDLAENYHVKNVPQLFSYVILPFSEPNPRSPGGRDWLLMKEGEVMPVLYAGEAQESLLSLGAPLSTFDPAALSLNRWLLDQRVGDDLTYPQKYLHMFLFGLRSGITPKSPSDLGLPPSRFFDGIGLVVMRTGLEDQSDTLFWAVGTPYNMGGRTLGTVPNFGLHKYGVLTQKKGAFYRGRGHRVNAMLFSDPLIPPQTGIWAPPDGGFTFGNQAFHRSNIKDFLPNSTEDMGGTLRAAFQGDLDYAYQNLNKFYVPERVKSYSRQYLFLKPKANTQRDYVVVFDRPETVRPDIVKRWEINCAYRPQISGVETQVREGKWEYSGSDQIVISNTVSPDPYSGNSHSDHGKLFIRTLLPQRIKTVLVGGPGHELETDAGEVGNTNPDQDSDYWYLRLRGALHTMTYHLDVVALESNAKENFLHVLQTADASDPAQAAGMVETSLLESPDGKLQGAFIDQSEGQPNAVVLFAKNEEILDLSGGGALTYTYGSSADTGLTRHLISDLKANRSYDVIDTDLSTGSQSTQTFTVADARTQHAKDRNAAGSTLAGDQPAGILSFTTALSSPHRIQIVESGNQPPTQLCGDLNKDGKVDIADAVLLAQIIVGSKPPPQPPCIADFNSDGQINVVDLVLLIKFILGQAAKLSCCGG